MNPGFQGAMAGIPSLIITPLTNKESLKRGLYNGQFWKSCSHYRFYESWSSWILTWISFIFLYFWTEKKYPQHNSWNLPLPIADSVCSENNLVLLPSLYHRTYILTFLSQPHFDFYSADISTQPWTVFSKVFILLLLTTVTVTKKHK